MDFVATSIIFLASSLFGVYLLFAVIKFLHKVCWKPIYIQYSMRSQGVEGPSYRFLHGNTKEMIEMKKKSISIPMEELSHDILPKIQPHTYSWINKYGRNYMFWYGPRAFITTMETTLIKEVMNNKSLSYPKVEAEGYAKKILGNGLATAEGEQWAKLRKLANHAFHADRLKNMTPAMIASVEMMLERWKQYEGKEIEVFEEFKLMTSEVISRTAFSSSYVEGKDVFEKLSKLTLLLSKNDYKIKIPILSWIFKSRDEIEAEKLERGIKESIIGMITKREKEKVGEDQAEPFGNDYLGLLVKASHGEDDGYKLTVDDVVGDCKTFYLAGHETTTTLLSWAFLLLGIHTDWQEKARQEVLDIFGKHLPNTDGLSRMKTINMIINETLRLYPPVASLHRKVKGNVRLGKFNLSDNMVMSFPTLALHHDPQIWGDDVNKFKPDRFSEGIAKATNNNPAAFQPFGLGPRTCVGNNFATNEAKIALTMILQRYSFTLSPTYIHSPVPVVTIRPQHGLQMSMIINETLRLYGPALALTRTVERKTKLGKIIVPANTELLIPVLALHHDPDIWGQDSHLFRPERFGEGVAKATKGNPMTFIPFGFGPRTCVGKNFASIEADDAIKISPSGWQRLRKHVGTSGRICKTTPLGERGVAPL